MKKLSLALIIIFTLLCQANISFAATGSLPAGYNPGDLVKLSTSSALYYLSVDGRRFVFPTSKTYFTWYANFNGSRVISAANLANIPLGKLITYRPGIKMVKQQTNPTVFVVSRGGILHSVPNEATASALYGVNWGTMIDDIDDAFWFSYTIGTPLTSASDYNVAAELAAAPTINADNNLNYVSTSSTASYTLTTTQGAFQVRVTELSRDSFNMITDTAYIANCSADCPAKSLADYVNENGASIGMHGTYFCPPDYSGCATKVNTFDWPVYNTADKVMINEDRLKFHDGPLMASDTNGKLYYYHRAKDFGTSIAAFESRTGAKLQAEISNYPSLLESNQIVVMNEQMDDKQRTVKGARGAIGFNDKSVFLVIASAATVPDMAYIMQTLGATDAMNLDGGGSIAMIYNNAYVTGPGRLLPNAIVFKSK